MDEILNMVMAGVVGLVIGGLFMFFKLRSRDSEQSVKAVENKLHDYQQEVEAHFAKTADLIDNLTDSYKAVFHHLSESAENLLTEEQIQHQLMNRRSREVTIQYLKGEETASESNQNKENPTDT